MPKIGILGCQSATNEMNCVMVGCLGNVRGRQGTFAGYNPQEPLDLIGIIGCGGCPTAVAADRIWQKVKALAEYGIDALHLTSCLVHLCPFKDEFVAVIREEFPEIQVIEGTHPFHDLQAVKAGVKELLSQREVTPQSMNDLVFKRIKISPRKKK
ncbi:MAG TPA: CGGC domain-containing protein [Desulfomonilaceae bacterium]|nr:CGGC domain-containing protein [Desulfomonilaceae bacterium]